jgi:hypothetical protein
LVVGSNRDGGRGEGLVSAAFLSSLTDARIPNSRKSVLSREDHYHYA